jgi:putative ABC transport system substrate-binding protein
VKWERATISDIGPSSCIAPMSVAFSPHRMCELIHPRSQRDNRGSESRRGHSSAPPTMLQGTRRQFISLLGVAAAWPLAASAQQSIVKARRLGILLPGAPPEPLVEALFERLRELGYREGRDVVFELRWAQGKNERLTELASELVAAKVDVITTISTPAALAARKVTTTIPIVFTGVGDPVGAGVVSSLSHPDGNATGLSLLATKLSAKRLELLREIEPRKLRS